MAKQVGTSDNQYPWTSPWASLEVGTQKWVVGHPWATQGSQVLKPRYSTLSLGLYAISPFPLGRPALLVRAARHYEGAGQILVRQAVMSAQLFVSTEPVELPAPGQWVVAECPARVDFSGEPLLEGWGEGGYP